MSRLSRGSLVALTALLCLSCKANTIAPERATTPIKTLLDDPGSYDGKIVSVAGNVQSSVGVLGFGAYKLNDGTGTLSIVTDGGGVPVGVHDRKPERQCVGGGAPLHALRLQLRERRAEHSQNLDR